MKEKFERIMTKAAKEMKTFEYACQSTYDFNGFTVRAFKKSGRKSSILWYVNDRRVARKEIAEYCAE